MTDIEILAGSSNDLLSDEEQSAVHKRMDNVQGEVYSLEKNITQLHETIRSLEKRRSEGLSGMERLCTGIAPHKKIPPEILSQFFLYAKSERALRLPPRPDEPIWPLMQVCSRWREIILAEPLIWAKIRSCDSHYMESLNPLIHEIFANRGSACLITYWEPWISTSEAWEAFLKLLSMYPSRYKHLGVIFRDFIPPPLHKTPITLEYHESIYISSHFRFRHHTAMTPTADFFISEALRKVSVSAQLKISPSKWLSRVSLPWSQLTDLTIEPIPASALATILGQSVHLVICTVLVEGGLLGQDIPSNYVQLTCVEYLKFSTLSDFSGTRYLLDILTVPALQELHFEDLDWNIWPQESVLQLVSRSACQLKVLETPHLVLEEWELVPLMRELHAYTKRSVTNSTINQIRRERLTPQLCVLNGLKLSSLHSFIELLERGK
ncbi:hypothetical protein BDZ94DRAFT_1311008 [Collybia nuda]|uniref:F-box domain-containing protein n=1 Tax=Collybia nuda TaxID=64659 RepID=A0A9P5Y0I3_9AGAR|nr:hypothetical protein BDZ94DRAFT_1311008 [Collybia nuda]